MIRFTVVWHPEAEDELASIWLDAADRQSVALAVNAIDRHLATDATAKGIQVEGDLRQLTALSLRVICGKHNRGQACADCRSGRCLAVVVRAWVANLGGDLAEVA